MKRTFALALIVCLSIVLLNCKDDEDPALNTPGSFTYKGKEYPLVNGYLNITCSISDEAEEFWHHDLMFFPAEASVTTQCSSFFVDGSGDAIVFGLDSRMQSGLTEGTYTPPDAMKPDNLKLGSALYYDFAESTWVSKGTEGGCVTVSKTGDEYSITFTTTVVQSWGGGTLTGKFKGVLQEY
jgi:hypothetical protein